MADEIGKKDQDDASKGAISAQAGSEQPVSPGAIPVVQLDTLLAPNSADLPPVKSIPAIMVMPHQPPPPPTPAVQAPAAASPKIPASTLSQATVSPIKESRPVPKEIEKFIQRTTQRVQTSAMISPPAPDMAPQTPLPMRPTASASTTTSEPVILSETTRAVNIATPTQSIQAGPPVIEPATPTPTSPSEGEPSKKSWGPFSKNISDILNAIKLPERFDAKASGDIKNRPQKAAADPVIISETVTPAKKEATPLTSHDTPAPMHLAPEIPIDPMYDVGLPHRTPEPIPAPPPAAVDIPEVTKMPDPVPSAPAADVTAYTPEKDIASGHPPLTTLRTFKEDLMHVVQDRQISLVSAVALEADRKHEVSAPSEDEIAITHNRQRRVMSVLFAIIILLGLSGAALFGIFTVQSQHATPLPNPNNTSIIFAEQTFSFPLQDLTPSDIKRSLAQSHGSTNASLGSITRIVPTVKTIDGGARAATTEEFFKAMDLHVSDDLIRALSSEFFFGIHTIDKDSTILIIPVLSYERAFAGMLAWEPTMNTDFAPTFTAVTQFTYDKNGLPQRRTFEDVVMRNYDTRVLKDDSGTVQMYYSFPTPNILIISENPFSFTEILSRLQVQRRL